MNAYLFTMSHGGEDFKITTRVLTMNFYVEKLENKSFIVPSISQTTDLH